MTGTTQRTGTRIIPTLRYHNAPAAIDWLCEAFGFERHLVVPGATEQDIAHAQLVCGSSMIMVGSVREDEFGKWVKAPRDLGGANTQSAYMVVDEVDDHYARAKAAGAEIVYDLCDEDHGRGYSCRDPEGYLWSFGDYDPWKSSSAEAG